MFIDRAKIYLKAGNGGNGAVSFRREKYIPAGGPDGGDGGKGGDIIFIADNSIRTLVDFRYMKHYKAQTGMDGGGSNKTGKSGLDLIIKVPPGTIIKDAENDHLLADIKKPGETVIIAKGGRGGKGNSNFSTASRQAPNFAKSGEPGEELWINIDLKLIADVGLVGFPNVGKSTILSMVSAARPKIANYPFTTLEPNLGVVDISDGKGFVLADIPGLIEGAHSGAGLGHEFLKHIERTRLLIHVVDMSGTEGRDPLEDFEKINSELEQYNVLLASKPRIIAANKMDITVAADNFDKFVGKYQPEGYDIFRISAATGEGLKELMYHVSQRLSELPEIDIHPALEEEVIYTAGHEKLFNIDIEQNGTYVVSGKMIDRIIGSVNFEDHESMQYFQRVLKNKGIIKALEKMGIQEGDLVKINKIEFDYLK